MKEWHGDDIDTEHVVEQDGEEVAATAAAKVLKLKEEIESLRKEKQEYMDGWQRSKADYVNLLKRFETGATASELKGKIEAIEVLLPAFDALERSKEHSEIPEGFTAIAKQLESAFGSLGLEELGVIGEHFNPAVHEALGQDAADTLETDDTITVVLEKGWKIGDTVVRPAKVRVAHYQK